MKLFDLSPEQQAKNRHARVSQIAQLIFVRVVEPSSEMNSLGAIANRCFTAARAFMQEDANQLALATAKPSPRAKSKRASRRKARP